MAIQIPSGFSKISWENLIFNFLNAEYIIGLAGMTCGTVKDSIKSRGNLYVHNVDCDGKSLLVFAVKNHKRGEELMDDMKRYAKHTFNVFLVSLSLIDQ